MIPDTVITFAQRHHVEEISALYRSTWIKHHGLHPDVFGPDPGSDWFRNIIHRSVTHTETSRTADKPMIFAAAHEGNFAGYVMLTYLDGSKARNSLHFEIADICVADAYRGSGVGTQLIDHAKSVADRMGANRISARVWDGNDPSYKLFQDSGFQVQCTVMADGPRAPIPPPRASEPKNPKQHGKGQNTAVQNTHVAALYGMIGLLIALLFALG
ncbi:MAG: GNAT family N-acetyltransferase [Pseudomonadota bacterium]